MPVGFGIALTRLHLFSFSVFDLFVGDFTEYFGGYLVLRHTMTVPYSCRRAASKCIALSASVVGPPWPCTFRLPYRVPTEDRHELMCGRAVVRDDSRARLAQAVGRTMM